MKGSLRRIAGGSVRWRMRTRGRERRDGIGVEPAHTKVTIRLTLPDEGAAIELKNVLIPP